MNHTLGDVCSATSYGSARLSRPRGQGGLCPGKGETRSWMKELGSKK